MWYHFAFVAISLAMLGLAVAGPGSALGNLLFGARPLIGAHVGVLLVIAGVFALVMALSPVLTATLDAALPLRSAFTVALLFPLGLVMGFLFPVGVRALGPEHAALIPWACGLNGATPVMASVLGVALSMYAGFTAAAYAGAAAYAVALVAAGRLGAPPR
jgi:hypothetical protein